MVIYSTLNFPGGISGTVSVAATVTGTTSIGMSASLAATVSFLGLSLTGTFGLNTMGGILNRKPSGHRHVACKRTTIWLPCSRRDRYDGGGGMSASLRMAVTGATFFGVSLTGSATFTTSSALQSFRLQGSTSNNLLPTIRDAIRTKVLSLSSTATDLFNVAMTDFVMPSNNGNMFGTGTIIVEYTGSALTVRLQMVFCGRQILFTPQSRRALSARRIMPCRSSAPSSRR